MGALCELSDHCWNRGEEDRYLYDPRALQDQDPREASYQGRSASVLRTGNEGEGQASQDCYQGLSSCGTQGTDLSSCLVLLGLVGVPETCLPWNPMEQVWEPHFPRMWRTR